MATGWSGEVERAMDRSRPAVLISSFSRFSLELYLLLSPACVERRDQKIPNRKNFMAPVIEFYIPARFKPKVKWVPQEQRGKSYCVPVRLERVRVRFSAVTYGLFNPGFRHNHSLAIHTSYLAGQCLSFRLVDRASHTTFPSGGLQRPPTPAC
jgi:hypothetical protein